VFKSRYYRIDRIFDLAIGRCIEVWFTCDQGLFKGSELGRFDTAGGEPIGKVRDKLIDGIIRPPVECGENSGLVGLKKAPETLACSHFKPSENPIGRHAVLASVNV
jgi:hypothetical protein